MSQPITPDWIVRRMKLRAESGFYTGLVESPGEFAYFDRCSFGWQETRDKGHRLIFTRDIGHHSSGWFKNPDYERCYHLSLSFWQPGSELLRVPDYPRPHDHAAALEWCKLFFGKDRKKLWIEPPYTREGKQNDVYHYRLFCDEHWQAIKPSGEVYSTDLTEKGWKSFSELHAEDDLRDAVHSMGVPG